jgi:hypothetical protein
VAFVGNLRASVTIILPQRSAAKFQVPIEHPGMMPLDVVAVCAGPHIDGPD